MAAGGPEVGRKLAGPIPPARRSQTAAAQESMSVADRLRGRCASVTGKRRNSNSHYGRFDPRRVRAPGLHAPQNRPLVGRAPAPGVPIWSIMRIAARARIGQGGFKEV